MTDFNQDNKSTPVYTEEQNANVSNLQPDSTKDLFIYLPISDFSRIGAKVDWDENHKVFRVTSDYHLLKDEIQQLRQKLTEIAGDETAHNLRAIDLNWEMHLADQGNTSFSSSTMPTDLKLLTLKKDPFNNASSLFAVNQNQLYSVERISKKILSATDLDTYKERWNFTIAEDYGFLDLIARDGVVYASTMTKIYAIKDNGTSSQTLWTIDNFANRLLLDQNTLFYYTRVVTGGLVAIASVDINTGQKKWSYTLNSQEDIERVFAAGGNRLYVNIRNAPQMTSKMYAFDTSTGTVLWTFDLESSLPIYGAPIYKDEKLYFETNPATKRTIWALNAASGNTLWRFSPTGSSLNPMAITADSLIVLDDTNIIAVDKNSGVQKWKALYADSGVSGGFHLSNGLIIASDKIILGNNNKIKFFNTANGQLIYSTLQLSTSTGDLAYAQSGSSKTRFLSQSLINSSIPSLSQNRVS